MRNFWAGGRLRRTTRRQQRLTLGSRAATEAAIGRLAFRQERKLISRGPKRSQAPETEVEPPPWLEFEPEPGRRLS